MATAYKKPKKKKVKKTAKVYQSAPIKQSFNEHELVASICKQSLYDFVREFWDTVVPEEPVWNWHIEFLCNEAQRLAEDVFRGRPRKHDEVINVSPGTTKSLIWSVFLPAWIWTRMPHAKFIGASHSFHLAMDLSSKCRDVVTSDKYQACFPYVQLRADQNTKGYFKTTAGGYRYAVGVGGSVMGMHGHFIVIDDPLDPEQAWSELDLAAANRWILSTLLSRKVDKRVTVTVLVMQRLHQDDPSARFLARKVGKIRHICLPAEDGDNVNPPELRDRYVNGLMDPVRLSREVLEEYQANGDYYYAAQFLQTPVPKDGAMFNVNRFVVSNAPPPRFRFVRLVRYWDKAATKGGGAYTVGTLMGLDLTGRFWILDVKRFRLDSYHREKKIRQTADEDGPSVLIGVEQEPGSGGKDSAEYTVRNLAGFRVIVVKVDKNTGGKLQRADPYSSQVNGGNVYVLQSDWNEAWIMEHKFFPNSKYKDQVDSAAGAFSLTHKRIKRVGAL